MNNYFLKVKHEQHSDETAWFLKNPLALRVLHLCALRARKSETPHPDNGLEQWEFYISKTEYEIFGLKKTQSTALWRMIVNLIKNGYVSKVDTKTGTKGGNVYRLNNNKSYIYWGRVKDTKRTQKGHQKDTERTGNKSSKISKKEFNEETKKMLLELPKEKVAELSSKYECTPSQVRDKAEDLVNYCEANGKAYVNYMSALAGYLRRDYGKRKSIDDIAEEEGIDFV